MFDRSYLEKFLNNFSLQPTYWIAYSGGLDSHVLLHALANLPAKLTLKAIHIHHGLQPNADQWAEHCVRSAQELNIPCEVIKVNAQAKKGESPEAAARAARYQALAKIMAPGDYLITAHHQNDQAETLLLQLFRGAGVKGLAAMAEVNNFVQGYHLRPLLPFTRDELQAYAAQHQLQWIEDASNTNLKFYRNFIRHELLPIIQQRWPSVLKTLTRTARHCAEAAEVLEEVAKKDLFTPTLALPHQGGGDNNSLPQKVEDNKSLPQRVEDNKSLPQKVEDIKSLHQGEESIKSLPPLWGKVRMGGKENNQLSISQLLLLPPARQRNVLRYWLQQLNIPTPNESHLIQIQQTILPARKDSCPIVSWEAVEIRRYKDHLYVLNKSTIDNAITAAISWNLNKPLELPGIGTLIAKKTLGQGIRCAAIPDAQVMVKFRQDGERIHPQGRQGSHPLKKLFQEWQIPPWQRDQIPLIYCQEQLIAVVNYALHEKFITSENELGWEFVLQPVD